VDWRNGLRATAARARALRAVCACAAVATAALVAAPAFAQDAALLKDIRSNPAARSDPHGVVLGDTFWFAATDDTHGRELWKSDGTPAGTVLVRDVAPGGLSSSPSDFVEFAGRVWFRASGDGGPGRTLWSTDGTAAGTVEVPLPEGSQPGSVLPGIFVAEGRIWFSTVDEPGYVNLWALDEDGTQTLVFDHAVVDTPRLVAMVDGHALIRLRAGTGRFSPPEFLGLWTTDGVGPLVRRLWGFYTLDAWRVGSLGDRTVVAAEGNAAVIDGDPHLTFLWISDGSGGLTGLRSDLVASTGRTGATPEGAELDGRLYFLGRSPNDVLDPDIPIHAPLFATDGTAAGTVAVAPSQFASARSGDFPRGRMYALPGCVVFALDTTPARVEWWRTDGTDGGTFRLASDSIDTIDPFGGPRSISARVGDFVYFPHAGSPDAAALWRTDGTLAGTQLVKDVNPSVGFLEAVDLTESGLGFVFLADDSPSMWIPQSQLWYSDGTAEGTVVAHDFGGEAAYGWSEPYVLGSAGATVFLVADDGEHGPEPWAFHPPQTDTDGDGLLDAWETKGYTAEDGTFVDLPALGADPRHKDVFVEIDYMEARDASGALLHTHRPRQAAIDRIVAAFDRAPVANPDGETGIHLHVFVGDALPEGAELGVRPATNVYDWTAFDSIRRSDPARALAFRYCVFAHDIPTLTDNAARSSGIARGAPESDFIVSLGSFTGSVGSEYEQAGTFMHELGHCLGLGHGGGDEVPTKPNYLSVMNYLFQTEGLVTEDEGRKFDYSRQALDPLDETKLADGDAKNPALDLPSGLGTKFWGREYLGPPVKDWTPYSWREVPAGATTIDWDGLSGTSVGPSYGLDVNKNVSSVDVLAGWDDWAHLNFRGGTVGAGAPSDPLPPRPQTSEAVELDVRMAKEIALAVPLDPETGLAETSGAGAGGSGSSSAPVAGVKVTASGSQIVVTWKPATQRKNATYRVYRSVDGGYSLLLAETRESSYQDRAVESGRTYAYSVTVDRGNGGESWPSDPVGVRAK